MSFGKKSICDDEMRTLWAYFRVVDRNKDRRALRKMLETTSLGLGKDRKRLLILFSELYNRFKNSRPLKKWKATSAFKALSLKGSELKMVRQVGTILRDLITLIEEFLVRKSLKERPALRTMILAESVKTHSEKDLFRTLLSRWATAIEGMKVGSWRLYQRWRYEDAVHFSPSQLKVKTKYSNLPAARTALKTLSNFYEAFYEAERLSRTNQFAKEKEWSISPSMLEDACLADLYLKVVSMLEKKSFDQESFDQSLRSLRKHHSIITPNHRVNLFGFLLNYLTAERRKGLPSFGYHCKQCLELILEENFLDGVNNLTSSFVRNRITESTIIGDEELEQHLKKALLPRVVTSQRKAAELLEAARSAFNRDEHTEVVRILTYTDEKGACKVIKSVDFNDLLLLKIFLIQSLLVLKITGETPEEPIEFFYLVTDSVFKLLEDNKNDFSADRRQEIGKFVRVCQSLYREDLEMISTKNYQKQRELVLAPKVLAGRKWLYCYLAHFNPLLYPPPRPVQPTLNQHQPWASGEDPQ